MSKKLHKNWKKISSSSNFRIKKKIKKVFNKSFSKAVDVLATCKGKVICAGVGKSALISKKSICNIIKY